MADSEQSIVGDLINFRGLVYAPLNENGVVFLFGKVAEDLNMYIEEVKPGFPDCIARRFTGRGWERLRVEFEYKSGNFKQHGHDPEGCDLIICWENDWQDCPLEVLELKDRIREMENRPIKRPNAGGGNGKKEDIDSWFDRYKTDENSRQVFHELWKFVKSLDEACFYKVCKTTVSFYSPKRVFLYLYPRISTTMLCVFTRGKSMDGVKAYTCEGARKWGAISIGSMDELDKSLPLIEESFKRINEAIKNNESTSCDPKAEDTDEESDE